MSDKGRVTAAELAEHVGGKLIGENAVVINGLSDLQTAIEGEVTYVEEEKFFETALTSLASCLLVPEGFVANGLPKKVHKVFIEVARPKLAFARAAGLFYPPKKREPGIHPTAVVANSADIALTAFVGPHVVVGEYSSVGAGSRLEAGVIVGASVTIGDECVIHPNAVLYDGVTIGNRVILHAAVCLGADGFGYVRDDMGYHKFPQIGTVVIEDDVELGAGTCVDRAALGRTRIGRGSKLDNLVHVGHNCDIGERVVIAAQTGISGSVVIEEDAVIGGQVGFGDHTRVLKGAVIGSKAGILPGKIVRSGVWWGIPVQPLDEYKRQNAHVKRLPQMSEELKELRQRLQALEDRLR